jgi:hypothetical protein
VDRSTSGALACERSGDPNVGGFADATILKTFGEFAEDLDELRRLDSSPAAPLAPNDFIALLKSAFAFAILAWLLLVGALRHGFLSIARGSTYWQTKPTARTAKSLKYW